MSVIIDQDILVKSTHSIQRVIELVLVQDRKDGRASFLLIERKGILGSVLKEKILVELRNEDIAREAFAAFVRDNIKAGYYHPGTIPPKNTKFVSIDEIKTKPSATKPKNKPSTNDGRNLTIGDL